MANVYTVQDFGPSDLLSDDREGFRRTKVQAITIGQQYILNGIGFETNWQETGIATGAVRYAEFTVPAGYYMVLALRDLNPSSDKFRYVVYPQNTYTLGAVKTDSATDFAFTRNLRQGSPFSQQWLVRYNVTVAPPASSFIVNQPIYGQINAGNRSVGNYNSDNSFLMLMGNQKFLLKMANEGVTNAMDAQVILQYAFIPEALIPDIKL